MEENKQLTCALCNTPIMHVYQNESSSITICEDCKAKFHNELKYAKDLSGITDLIRGGEAILYGLHKLYGINQNDDNFRETPHRLARLMLELNYGTNIQAAKDILESTSFPSNYNGLISSNNITVSSLCPHHMVVVDYSVNVAYIPSNKCIGLSKLPRVVKTLAKSMRLQEDFTFDLANVINNTLKPAGVGVIVNGIHNCISARGIEMRDINNTTSTMLGIFLANPTLKQEWLDLISLQK